MQWAAVALHLPAGHSAATSEKSSAQRGEAGQDVASAVLQAALCSGEDCSVSGMDGHRNLVASCDREHLCQGDRGNRSRWPCQLVSHTHTHAVAQGRAGGHVSVLGPETGPFAVSLLPAAPTVTVGQYVTVSPAALCRRGTPANVL